MLDIKWAMEQFGIEDENIAIRILEKFDKFNYGCFSCGSSSDLVYTEIGEVICKECRNELCINDDGLIDSEDLSEVFELAFIFCQDILVDRSLAKLYQLKPLKFRSFKTLLYGIKLLYQIGYRLVGTQNP